MNKKGFTPTPILALLRSVFLKILMQIKFLTDSKIATLKSRRSKNTMPIWVSGFTLIELLVVIAIIGILATIVLASLNTARLKAVDSAIISDLRHARAAASVYFDDHGQDYTGVCTDPTGVQLLINGSVTSGSPSTPICNDASDAWAIQAQLKEVPTNYWCVDSTGASLMTTTTPLAGTTCI
jgi:prepilin-type N-terminal cleavage/methylation domain-containing protein